MPTYEYNVVNECTGDVVGVISCLVPVQDRDAVRLARRTAPRTIAIAGTAPAKLDQASEVLAGYRREECRIGNNREFQHKLGEFTPAQIKEAWSAP